MAAGSTCTVYLKPAPNGRSEDQGRNLPSPDRQGDRRTRRHPAAGWRRRDQGGEGLLRIRSGDFRILHTVQDEVLTVLVVNVGHRREVYRR